MPDLVFDYQRYRVAPGSDFRLATRNPADTQGLSDKSAAKKLLKENRSRLAELQERLYAEGTRSLLLVLQAMDTGGKDSTIRSVMTGVNPQGVRIASFKAPSANELAHDYLWRVHEKTPPRGHIGIFNRSHYEDVLVVRVHQYAPLETIERRYGHINAFEKLLHDEGTRVIKVMLHISKDYQRQRLIRRLERPEKHWKFNPGDLDERGYWEQYEEAYSIALSRCSTEHAPWYVIPAEHRWFRNLLISRLLVDTLEEMNPQFPAPNFDPADFPPDAIV